jgi:hypothetical protein
MSSTDLLNNDPIAHSMRKQGASWEEIAVALWQQKQQLLERALELDAIAPKKYTLADGTCMVWRCPDELIPEKGAK